MSYPYGSMQTAQSRVEVVNAFMRGVYGWMCLGLLVTAGASVFTIGMPAMRQLVFGNQIMFFGLIIAELALVVGLSAAINRLSARTASLMFLAYSALNGITCRSLSPSIPVRHHNAFLVSGRHVRRHEPVRPFDQKDLTSFGSFLFMGLLGIIIASISTSSQVRGDDFVISCVGVLVFPGPRPMTRKSSRSWARWRRPTTPRPCAGAPSSGHSPCTWISSTCSS
jgi:FtsH-binding integral membrane protein